MTEDELLKKLFPLYDSGTALVGPGDDCAVYHSGDSQFVQLVSVDQLIEGKHYLKGESAYRAGRKLLARNLSDIAAMGGVAEYALIALTVANKDEKWIVDFHKGIADLAGEYKLGILGGDLAKSDTDTMASLTITGKAERGSVCLRSAAQAGHKLYATGCFGRSFPSEHHLDFVPRLKEAYFLAAHSFAKAMMDVTDGLVRDLARMAKASGCSVVLNTNAVERRHGASLEEALSDGEDYELIFSVEAGSEAALLSEWPFETDLTCIGEFRDLEAGKVFDEKMNEISGKYQGFDHFVS